MMRYKPGSGGVCDRCMKPARTLKLKECDDIVDVCKNCLWDSDFGHFVADDIKPVITMDEIEQMTLDIGAAMHRLGIPVWYNEDFNVIRYSIVGSYLKDWRSYEVGRYDRSTKWWELKQTHPYWKDIKDPREGK